MNFIWKNKSDMLKKLWLNQFAFSLFGIFVATPFSGTGAILAGCFGYLFYMFTVGFAILDDSQKDKISYNAGRNNALKPSTGLMYGFMSFFPTIVLTVVYTLLSIVPGISENITHLLYMFNRFVLCGEILGIDMGLTNTVQGVDFKPVNLGPDWAVTMSTHGIFPIIYAIVTPLLFGLIYFLGFKGIISVNTTNTKQKY